ncbi:MAG: SRPBCC domain-containing protein [Gemmatimonadota bacterium]
MGPGAAGVGPKSSQAPQPGGARPTAEILHDFPIQASAARVFEEITSPSGLDRWWTARSAGEPRVGTEYQLWFGPEYDWRARVTQSVPDRAFQLEMTVAGPDWAGTRIGFVLEEGAAATTVRFYHTGWPDQSDHYRISSFCWAMYLRILKRHLEHGEVVPYDQRLSV